MTDKKDQKDDKNDQEQEVRDDLVPMTKNGETIRVHPTCVKGHTLAGWKAAE